MINHQTPDPSEQDPRLLGDILADIGQVNGAKAVPERVRGIEVTTGRDEVAGLKEEREELLASASLGELSPESQAHLQRVEDAIWEAETEGFGSHHQGPPASGN